VWCALWVQGLIGVALFVGPTATPVDHPGMDSLYRLSAEAGVGIWVHPNRPQAYADYDAYAAKGSLHQIWNTLGEWAAYVGRLLGSGDCAEGLLV
jgi:hypothetical protein